jgi:signal peptidase I
MSKKETTGATEPKSKKVAPPKSIIAEYFESFVVTLIMALFGMTFIIQAVTVPTGSMQNTILVGDYLLVNKFIFAPSGNPLPFLPQRNIRRGDVVVFKYPGFRNDPERDEQRGLIPYQINYVKRVIGLPGEKVEFRNNQVFVNDKLLSEYRVIGDAPNQQSALNVTKFEDKKDDAKYTVYYSERTMKPIIEGQTATNEGYQFGVAGKPMIVPEGNYFVMGDSRDNSEDGRFWGFVPRELIIGQAMFVYWSCDRGASEGGLAGCITHPRIDRIGTMIK